MRRSALIALAFALMAGCNPFECEDEGGDTAEEDGEKVYACG